MSLTTSYWGEATWKTLYSIAYTYPDDPTDEYKECVETFYSSMAHLLPCEECCEHYCDFLEENPVQKSTTNTAELLKWVNKLENSINRKLRRPEHSLTARLADLDRHNPDIKKDPNQKNISTYQAPHHSQQAPPVPVRRRGGISIRRPIPPVTPAVPPGPTESEFQDVPARQEPQREYQRPPRNPPVIPTRNSMSYGIRRTRIIPIYVPQNPTEEPAEESDEEPAPRYLAKHSVGPSAGTRADRQSTRSYGMRKSNIGIPRGKCANCN